MTVFYRKYRPQSFSQIIGQKHIVETLLSQLKSGKIGHGYLFAGPRGTGKTSCARIFAKAVNCQGLGSRKLGSSKKTPDTKRYPLDAKFSEPCNKCDSCLAITDGSHLDLIEIDAASNRGIEEIRDLREKIKLAPVSGRFKVYIIDEAHMLTQEAFNALLKTLEEPPAHAIFILCTTLPVKLPSTIISRLARFNFARAQASEISQTIKNIAKSEAIKISDSAISAIVKAADGSFRDAVSILDQLSSMRKTIEEKDVLAVAAISGWDQLYFFVSQLSKNEIKSAVLTIEGLSQNGADMSLFAREVILFLEKLLLFKIGITLENFDLDDLQIEKIKSLASEFKSGDLQNLMKLFLIAEGEIKIYPLPQIPLVLAVCKYAGSIDEQTIADGQHFKVQTETDESPSKEASLPQEKDNNIKAVKSKKIAKSLASFEKKWQEFLNKVKPLNAHVVALLRSTRPIAFDDASLTLEVFYRFHKEKLEEPKILTMLGKVMDEVIGSPIKLKFVLATKKSSQPAAVKVSDVVDINQFELEEAVQEIFSKQ